MARIRTVKLDTLPSIQEVTRFQCCLYVIEEVGGMAGAGVVGGYFKVGIASHPTRRLCALQCGNPRRLRFVAVYEGARGACLEIERLCLRFLRTQQGTEWGFQDSSSKIIYFLNAFAEEDK